MPQNIKAVCQVVHKSPGRLRLQVPGLKSQPLLGKLLISLLLQQTGVLSVKSNLISESLIIGFDPAVTTAESLLVALQHKQKPDPGQQNLPHSTSPPPHRESFPFRNCQVVHAIKGRARLLCSALEETDKAHALKTFLEQQAGIKRVRVNLRAKSVVVHYEAIIWDAKALATLIRAYDPLPEDLDRSTTLQREIQSAAQLDQPKKEMVLAGAALVLSLVGGPAVPLALGLLWFSSQSIRERTLRTLRQKNWMSIDTLDAAALSVLALQGMFWQVSLLNLMLSTAEFIRASTQERARKELADVLHCMTDQAWIKQDGQMILISADALGPGDTVYVFPGERIPVDGLVIAGVALVDQHMLTGESLPVTKVQGDMVYAATAIFEGEIKVQVTHAGSETQVARIIQMIESAPLFDTRAQDHARQWANRLVPFSFLGAGILALTGNFAQAAALLVIDYGAGFKVAAPTTIMSAMTRAARQGIFIRGGRHLEQLATIDAIVFDKTGTLTIGSPEIVDIIALESHWSENDLLTMAAAAEQCLNHPVAAAVTKKAKDRGLPILERDNFEYVIGQGISAQINGHTVLVGSQRFLTKAGISFDEFSMCHLMQIEEQPISPLGIAIDGSLSGLLAIADPIREEAACVIQNLRGRGIGKMIMLTGDRAAVGAAVADQVGLEEYAAEVFPGDKLTVVKALQEEGYKVAVIGDGINDSPALAQADVGIAVNGGTALAQETADVVFLQGNLHKLLDAIDISREGMALLRQNWDIIRIPNTIGLGLAFTGFIGPLGASLLSDGAALIAGGNALRPLLKSENSSGQ